MRRRLTLAILGTVAVTVLVVGLGTLLLTRLGAREQAEEELRDQAAALAAALNLARDVSASDVPPADQLDLVRRRLDLRDFEVVLIRSNGELTDETTQLLPSGVEVDDLDPERLARGAVVSGNSGSEVYAAAAVNIDGERLLAPDVSIRPAVDQVLPSALAVVVVTADPDAAFGPAMGWLLVASLGALAVGAVVAWTLGRGMSRPVVEATTATRRIAAGDLDVRVEASDERGDELAELGRSINRMAENLERSRGLEQQFLMSVSHDLRTPLTSIQGYAEAIADGATPDPGHAAEVIGSEANRLARLVQDLLDLAKLDANRFSLRFDTVDANDIVRDTVDGFRHEAADAGIELEIAALPGCTLTTDPDRLGQIVANLVQNGLKYASSTIATDVTRHDGSVEISVTDDGPGIASGDLPYIFERLYIAQQRPVRRESGSGLGLAIVRELVMAMGGSVRADAVDPTGTRMTVTLPGTTSADEG